MTLPEETDRGGETWMTPWPTARTPTVRLPVGPTCCEVLGQRAKADSPLWTGLDMSRAELRIWKGYPHLGVPWCHPEDRTGSPDDFDCTYRVYPIPEIGQKWKRRLVTALRFERDEVGWWLVVDTVSPATPPTEVIALPRGD